MAIFVSILFKKLRGRLGNLTVYKRCGENVVRVLGNDIRDARTPRQLKHRAKFAALVSRDWGLDEVIPLGYPSSSAQQSINGFVSRNLSSMLCDEEFHVSLDFRQLRLSSGELAAPDADAAYDPETGILIFTQRRQPLKPMMYDDDLLYGIVWFSDKPRSLIVPLSERGESAETRYIVPEEYRSFSFHVYVFAVSARGVKTSETVWLSTIRL